MGEVSYIPGTGSELVGGLFTPWTTPENAGGAPDSNYASCGPVVEGTNTLVVDSFSIPSSGPPITGVVITPIGNIDTAGINVNWLLYSGAVIRYTSSGVTGLSAIGSRTNNLNFDTWAKLSTLKVYWSASGDGFTVNIDAFQVTIYTSSGGFRTRAFRTCYGRAR